MEAGLRSVPSRGDRPPLEIPAKGLEHMMDSLRWARLRLTLRAEETLRLPPYAGSTFRGAFGHAFKRVACPLRGACEPCAHRAVCVFVYVFETAGTSDGSTLAKGRTVSHPFVLEPPENAPAELHPGDALEVGLVLIGRAIALAPYFLAACRDMASRGLGRGRGRCRLARVVAEDPEDPRGRVVYDGAKDLLAPAVPVWSAAELTARGGRSSRSEIPPEAGGAEQCITLEFVTPTRLRQDADLVVRPEFATLVTALLRRLSVLAEVHCGYQSGLAAKEILAGASDVEVAQSTLRWHDWERYSARQGTRMALGGFVGRITFAGHFGPWLPLLRLGEVLHVGKGTAFGLGKYRITKEPWSWA